MGREFLSQAFAPVSVVSPSERANTMGSNVRPASWVYSPEFEPRKWCSKDAIWPEDEEWWRTQDVVYEAFLDGPLAAPVVEHDQAAAHETATVNHLEETLRHRFSMYQRENGIQHLASSPAAPQAPTSIDARAPSSARYTISEEELDHVVLDFVARDYRDENENDGVDEDEDFELNWDEDDEMDEDTDSDGLDETPPPSTPVATAAASSLSIPLPNAPACHAPASSTATPRSIHVPAHVPSTAILAPRSMSIARVRRFPVHSPRTEVVL